MKTVPSLLIAWLLASLASPAFAHEPVTRARTPDPDPGRSRLRDAEVRFPHPHGFLGRPGLAVGAGGGSLARGAGCHRHHGSHRVPAAQGRRLHQPQPFLSKSPGVAGPELDVLVVKGSEITRKMPPGHLNAIFLTNSEHLVSSPGRMPRGRPLSRVRSSFGITPAGTRRPPMAWWSGTRSILSCWSQSCSMASRW